MAYCIGYSKIPYPYGPACDNFGALPGDIRHSAKCRHFPSRDEKIGPKSKKAVMWRKL